MSFDTNPSADESTQYNNKILRELLSISSFVQETVASMPPLAESKLSVDASATITGKVETSAQAKGHILGTEIVGVDLPRKRRETSTYRSRQAARRRGRGRNCFFC